MPNKPSTQCLARGCPRLVAAGASYCEEEHAHLRSHWADHRAKQQTSGRGGRAWRRKRERIFRRDKYQCQECKRQGRLTFVKLHGGPAEVGYCDHIINLESGGTDSEQNLQTLCKGCHDCKTGAEARGSNGSNSAAH